MTRNDITTLGDTTLDELWEAAAVRRSPVPSPEEQQVGIVLLRELTRGEPVTIARLAQALDTLVDTAEAFVRDSTLTPFIHTSEGGRIQGFMGLAVTRTPHQITVNGRMLWTWCAYDSLFIPELLGDTAEVETRDPVTDQLNRLTVSRACVEAAEPTGIVASMVRPQAWDVTSAARVIESACNLMFFHASQATGERWQAKHPETILLSLDAAFAFGKRSNTHRFGTELARRQAQNQPENNV